MNLVGKIFTVLIFVMSLVFATFATMVHNTHKNWMAVVVDPKTGLAHQLEVKKTENEGLKTDNERLNKELDIEKIRHRNDLTKLENENKILKDERTKNEQTIAAKDTALRDAAAAMLACQEQVKIYQTRVGKLETDIKAAQVERDAKLKEVVRLTDVLNAAVNERVAVEKRNGDLAQELMKTRRALRYFGVTNIENLGKQPPNPLTGVVTAVPQPALVEVSLGSDDGLRKGHQLDVTRGGSYIGRIEVMEATPERAACRVDPKMLRKPIERGDRVDSSLVTK